MKFSSIHKFLLPSLLLSGTVFSVLTVPLAMFGSEEIVIQMQKEPFFHGKIRDVAAPYLGLVTALSIGVGVTSVAVAGWKQSSRKSAHIEEELSATQENLKKTEAQLAELKVSEAQLEACGLDFFLDNEVSVIKPPIASVTPIHEHKPVATTQVTQTIEMAQSRAAGLSVSETGHHDIEHLHTNKSKSGINRQQFGSSAQTTSTTVLKAVVEPSEASINSSSAIALTPTESVLQVQVTELQNQMQQMMVQVQTIHAVLQSSPLLVGNQTNLVQSNSETALADFASSRPARKRERRRTKLAS